MAVLPDAPRLDPRTFDDLVAEARSRISRYTPEWTDYNASDPGVTLFELFAWVTETMLYQINQVPERSYSKFLELIDIQQQPPRPALAHVSLHLKPGPVPVPVPRGTQLQAMSGGGESIIFETEEAMDALPISLATIAGDARDNQVRLLSTAVAPSTYYPFRPDVELGDCLYLGFGSDEELKGLKDQDAGKVFPRQLRLRVYLAGEPRSDSWRSSHRASGPLPSPWEVTWEYLLAGEDNGDRWLPLRVFQDETAGLTRDGYVVVEGPGSGQPATLAALEERRFWLRVRRDDASGPRQRPLDLRPLAAIVPNTVPAANLVTERDEELGEASGRANQSFVLRFGGLQPDSLILEVRTDPAEPSTWQRWTRCGSLQELGPDDKGYVLDIGHDSRPAEITFGDGESGAIPSPGAVIVALTYRHGGGSRGNVKAHSIVKALSGLPAVDHLTNEREAQGGRDALTGDALELEAPRILRHRERAVTADDYAVLAEGCGGVRLAQPLACRHPLYPGMDVPGAITLLVIPLRHSEDPGDPGSAPFASDELLELVAARLEPSRSLTAELCVAKPRVISVSVTMTVIVDRRHDPEVLKLASLKAVNKKISPILSTRKLVADEAFGVRFYPSGLIGAVEEIAGVLAVQGLSVACDGMPRDSASQAIQAPEDTIFWPGPHTLNVAID